MDPLTIAAVTAAITAAGSIGGGYLSRPSGKESKMQKTKRKLIDDLLNSVNGKGSYNDLFAMDDAAFDKAYVQPAKARFNNQIAPNIQQQYIATGQHRGTGLDDQLLRAGVDMDQMLNEQYYNFQNDAQNRKANAINGILSGGDGASPGMSKGEAFGQSVGGYTSSNAFKDSVSDIFKNIPNNQEKPPRKGYEYEFVGQGNPNWS